MYAPHGICGWLPVMKIADGIDSVVRGGRCFGSHPVCERGGQRTHSRGRRTGSVSERCCCCDTMRGYTVTSESSHTWKNAGEKCPPVVQH